MKKIKEKSSNSEGNLSFIEEIQKEINDKMGKLTAYNLKLDDPNEVKQWFSTGCELVDLICRGEFGEEPQNGGVPSGRILMINGESGAGKSLMVWHLIKDVIGKGGVAMYLDTEGATNLTFPEMIGCDTSKVIYVPPDKCETIEQMYELFDKFVMALIKSKNPNKFAIFVVDSFTQLSTEDEMKEENVGARDYPTKARIASRIMRKCKGLVPLANICLCFTNQLRTDIKDVSFYGDHMIVPTGDAQWFAASTVLRMYKSTKQKGDSIGDIVGQVIRVKCEKSRFTRSYREVKIPLHFEYGLQNEISIYDKLEELKCFNGSTKAKKWINDWENKEGAIEADKTIIDKGGSQFIFKFAAKDWTRLYKQNKDLRDWCHKKLIDEFMKPSEDWVAGDDLINNENIELIDENKEEQIGHEETQ